MALEGHAVNGTTTHAAGGGKARSYLNRASFNRQ